MPEARGRLALVEEGRAGHVRDEPLPGRPDRRVAALPRHNGVERSVRHPGMSSRVMSTISDGLRWNCTHLGEVFLSDDGVERSQDRGMVRVGSSLAPFG